MGDKVDEVWVAGDGHRAESVAQSIKEKSGVRIVGYELRVASCGVRVI